MSPQIHGRTVDLPVEVRDARAWTAHWLMKAGRAQDLVAPAGLEVAEPAPGRALASLVFVRYLDGDLDAYNEIALSFAVRPHNAAPATPGQKALEVVRRQVCAYIHRMPVNQSFTLEAGRAIWGYPKTMARIEINEQHRRTICTMHDTDGAPVLKLTVHDGLIPVPHPSVPTYTFTDGVLRRTRWESSGRALGRPRGATLFLGDHAFADEIRRLDLPLKPLAVTTVRDFRARFGGAEVVR